MVALALVLGAPEEAKLASGRACDRQVDGKAVALLGGGMLK